ncbi:hypothetical protein SAMN02787073_3077 [Chryseobacterium vrystaatense]|uniref:Lipocalin-like domain-containing protein n=1 Tax=Chryseobacterium vrystaatense TaxID=307480 RepID=A0A1M5EYJ3_9FLAO|nr:hypothetical protein SAMN02787073_3077 [Chryseobacterium vrystaatense]
MVTKYNNSVKFILIYFTFILLSSCSSSRLLGSWEFIDLYDGELTHIDTLKSKENNSRYGKGMLTFYKDHSFSSLESTGKYREQHQKLKMKYSDGADTIVMNISYISRNYLLLSAGKQPTTWFYRKK